MNAWTSWQEFPKNRIKNDISDLHPRTFSIKGPSLTLSVPSLQYRIDRRGKGRKILPCQDGKDRPKLRKKASGAVGPFLFASEKMFCVILNQFISECVSSSCRECEGEVQDLEETPALPLDGERRRRKRCGCGRGFSPKCNSQKFCEKCGELAERRRKSRWARKNRENMSVSRRLEPKFRKEIGIF